ncbi:MAG: DUF2934 domain-containing protein [Pirellulaceae bacterium]
MKQPELEALYLTDDELGHAKQQIEELAYYKWCEAGRPCGCDEHFWNEAELEWIEFYYVPHREFDGHRPR